MAFRFKDLEVWKLSKDFARDIYSVTSTFPEEERYALVSQLRRAAVSVMSNIAEGAERINRMLWKLSKSLAPSTSENGQR
ncbi:hypothetical protein RJ60_13865 [Mesotoga sp. B105.6.4]|nr:hypothetical protein RJ60_13865 [Mesotoga sp. B105.6.4]